MKRVNEMIFFSTTRTFADFLFTRASERQMAVVLFLLFVQMRYVLTSMSIYPSVRHTVQCVKTIDLVLVTYIAPVQCHTVTRQPSLEHHTVTVCQLSLLLDRPLVLSIICKCA